jgi:hypothetical protein
MHKYSITNKWKKILAVLAAVLLAFTAWQIGTNSCRAAEEQLITCWAMCKPGSYVTVRRSPQKSAMMVGYLDPCDDFLTDGKTSNGYIHVIGIGEYGEGWAYCGYVSTEEPEKVFEQYVCVSRARVKCRRWIYGPLVANYGWLTNGSNVQVFYRTSSWSVTNRGYIQSEWLEVDPE